MWLSIISGHMTRCLDILYCIMSQHDFFSQFCVEFSDLLQKHKHEHRSSHGVYLKTIIQYKSRFYSTNITEGLWIGKRVG